MKHKKTASKSPAAEFCYYKEISSLTLRRPGDHDPSLCALIFR